MEKSTEKRTVELGDVVHDTLTEFCGTVTARATYLEGCIRCEVQPADLHEGQLIEPSWFDEQRLVVLEAASENLPTAATGGPQRRPSRRNPPSV